MQEEILIINGCGYATILPAAALVEHRELSAGRRVRSLLTPRREVLSVLREAANNPELRRLYMVGLGLDLVKAGGEKDQQSPDAVLAGLHERGVEVFWFLNWAVSKDNRARCEDFLQLTGNPGEPLIQAVLRGLQATEADRALASRVQAAADSPESNELFRVVGFICRVIKTMPQLGERAIHDYMSYLRKGGELTEHLQKCRTVYRSFGRREIKGKSLRMEELRNLICRVAQHDDIRVMVLGETGTGKESVATHLHLNSQRWDKPMLSYNCASSNPGLMESAFRGYCKGAFTGAIRDRQGIFEQANGGTLFLDEVADLPLEAQGTLLRVLEEKRIARMGDHKEITVDVRLITATNKNLRQLADQGLFRRDLLFRLQEFTVKTLPLRCTPDDIPTIADFIWRTRRGYPLPETACSVLMGYSWPGNTRELASFLKYTEVCGAEDWEEALRCYLAMNSWEETPTEVSGTPEPSLPDNLQQAIAQHCRNVLNRCGGNISRAAADLGIQRNTLKKYLRLQ
ncbi:MAG: sigma 54-interacting transcriptional regulator [Akkermansia sp.]|nr:sigma 54-interacting transcriptional regulator [Akkermansia sp.]